jgi:hypothetical protein
MKLNGISPPFPRIIHGRIGQRDIQALALYISNLADRGFLVVDENLRQFLREEAELPREPEGLDVDENNVTVRQEQENAPKIRDRTGEKPTSDVEPQDKENKGQEKEMSEPEEFALTDEMIQMAMKRKEKLYGTTLVR